MTPEVGLSRRVTEKRAPRGDEGLDDELVFARQRMLVRLDVGEERDPLLVAQAQEILGRALDDQNVAGQELATGEVDDDALAAPSARRRRSAPGGAAPAASYRPGGRSR